ncbi:hypothetical protein JCM3765_005570 [Sporobolomyces pararoseus]
MSFNQLPTETIDLIVSKCAEADEAYKATQEGDEMSVGKNPNGTKEIKWKGRSCSAISLVSTTLRSLAKKHVFKVLRAAKVLNDTFQYSLLESAADCFTEIVFDEDSRSRPLSPELFKTVFHVLPQLPNLRSITGLKHHHLTTLFGSGPLSKVPDPLNLEPKKIRARSIFLETAARISKWGVEINQDSLQVLVDANTSGIRNLSISSPNTNNTSIFDTQSSRFPSILAKLPNLETLEIHQRSWNRDGHLRQQIVDSVFEVPFSFSYSLRSLELDFAGDCAGNLSKELQFASLFPALHRFILHVNGHDFWNDDDEDIHAFPSLKYLEIKGLQYTSLDSFFHSVELPYIAEIHFVALEIDSHTWPDLDELMHPLSLLSQSLVRVKISKTSGFDSTLPLEFARFGISADLDLDFETLCKMHSFEEEEEPESLSEIESSFVSLYGDPFHARSEEVLTWAIKRVEEMKHSDLRGGKELMEALKAVEDLKNWAES